MSQQDKFPSTRDMLVAMTHYAMSDESPYHIKCRELDDPRMNLIGFSVTITHHDQIYTREFWVSLSGDETPWHSVLRTPRGRDWVATSNRFGHYLWELEDPKMQPNVGQKVPWSDDLLKC